MTRIHSRVLLPTCCAWVPNTTIMDFGLMTHVKATDAIVKNPENTMLKSNIKEVVNNTYHSKDLSKVTM